MMERGPARDAGRGNAVVRVLRHVASLLVGILGGYVVLLCAGAIGMILTVPVVFLSPARQEAIGLGRVRDEPWFITLVAMISAFLAFHASLAVARYLLRLFPVHPTRPRWRLLIVLTLAYAAFGVRELGRAAAWFEWPRHDAFAVSELVVPLILDTVPVVVLLRWHLAWRRAGGDRYFVYLRKFGAVSDRAVYQSVLRALGHRHQPVLLVPRTTPFLNWEPFGAAFAGLSLRHPLRSIPVALSVADDEWEEHIRTLCRGASLIVADLSVESEALEQEMLMLSSERLVDRLVLLRSAGSAEVERSWKAASAGVPLVVTYRLHWRIPIIVLQAGLLLVWAAAIFHFGGASTFTLVYVPLVVLPILPLLVQHTTHQSDFAALRLRAA